MIIENGGNTGHKLVVTSEGRAKAACVSASIEHHSNHTHGLAYNAVFAVNPDGAGDCFFYLKNNAEDDLCVEGFWITTSDAEEIYVNIGDTGTAVKTNGADITPVNLNAGSGNTADVTCYSNISDGAVDITGLTAGRTVNKYWLTAASDTQFFNFESDLIIPKNYSYSMYALGGDTLLRGTGCF